MSYMVFDVFLPSKDSSDNKEKKSFSLEEKSKTSKNRVHYMKFTKGKSRPSLVEVWMLARGFLRLCDSPRAAALAACLRFRMGRTGQPGGLICSSPAW